MSLNIQTANGLLEIGGSVTKEKVISALGYEPADKEVETTVDTHTKDTNIHITSNERTLWNKDIENLDAHKSDTTVHVTFAEKETWNNKSDFSGAYADLIDAPNIIETESGNMVVTDESGNIIMQVDADGLATTNVNAKTIKLDGEDLGARLDEIENAQISNIVEDESGKVEFTDEAGNVIARIDANGFETTQVIADTVVVNGVNVEEKFTQVNERIDNISIPSVEGLATETYVDEKVAGIVNSAPETLDTLNELAAALGDDPNFATTVATQIGLKADKTALDTHTSDKVVHITAEERAAWNVKSDFSGDYNDLENAPNITEDDSESVIYADQNGNIIAKIDANGFETTTVTAQSVVVNGVDVETALDSKATSDHTHEEYLEASDIAGKADKTYVDDELTKKSDSTHTHEEYLVASDIANKADKTELHSHDNKTELDKIVDGKVAYWNNKSEFSGDYNDLTNAPNIYEDGSQSVIFADENGNIVMRVDGNGFETTTITAKSIVVNGVDVETTLDGKAASVHTHEQYLEASDIEGLATEEYVNAQLETKAGTNHAHEEYLTSDDISNKANISYVDEELATAIDEVKEDAANKDIVVLAEAQKGIDTVQITLDTHTSKTDIHITADERTAWNAKADKTYVDIELAEKADRATTLEGYGITDAASKAYVDTIIEGLTTEGTADAALVQAALKAHTDDKANPHAVTLSQLGVDATYAELNHVMGVTSNIQTQLDNKAGKSEVSTLKSNIMDGTIVAAEAQIASNALMAAKDGMGRLLHETYETKTDASNKAAVVLAQAQAYADSKQDTITGAATTIVSDDLEANRVLISDGSGKVGTHVVTAAELVHLVGVTSNVQNQLNAKADSSALSNYYTKTEIDNIELITVEDIDRICGMTIE